MSSSSLAFGPIIVIVLVVIAVAWAILTLMKGRGD
jgi:uncharacterized membrane protein YqiK